MVLEAEYILVGRVGSIKGLLGSWAFTYIYQGTQALVVAGLGLAGGEDIKVQAGFSNINSPVQGVLGLLDKDYIKPIFIGEVKGGVILGAAPYHTYLYNSETPSYSSLSYGGSQSREIWQEGTKGDIDIYQGKGGSPF